AMLGASGSWLSASAALSLLTFLMRAIRWTWILRPVARVRFSPAFRAMAAGFAANNLPGKVGEVLRPALLSRSERLPFSPLLASIVLERILDGATVIFFLLLALWVHPSNRASLSLLGLLPAAALCALVAATLFSVFRRAQTERLFERIWRLLPKRLQPRAELFAAAFVDGFASLKSPGLLTGIAAGSLGMWFVINLQIYCVLKAFRLDLPFSASYVVTAAAVLGLAVPTPGGLGSYQAAVDQALRSFFGVSKEAAAGVAILAWATSFVLITIIGLVFLALAGGQKNQETAGDGPGTGGRKTGDGAR
ncbi:MAG TPA: lysylphosphatidylglycerol synthase transmembrane domain-containing protein, partial [Thermoanaerobaculia bacterium]|nr:lysylphosphatidylglycerol synthase transmembrane domain-containing protein [Thermoanaerobaculia bacterium]